MPAPQLPQDVATRDAELQAVAADTATSLALLRWQWTLDETNPDRVSFRAYAKAAGLSDWSIRQYANGYAAWLAARGESAPSHPGQRTLTEHINLARMGTERQAAAKAVAKATGRPVSQHAVANKRALETARERAERRGTSVEEEVESVAEWHERKRRADKKEKDESRKMVAFRYMEVEDHLHAAKIALVKALNAAKDVDLNDEHLDILRATVAQARAVLDLIDLRMAGSVEVDWDAELADLTGEDN